MTRKEKREEKLLRLWKNRMTAEGHNVSKVKTLAEANKFQEKKSNKRKAKEK